MIKKVSVIIKRVFLALIVVLLFYYVVIWIDTREVMIELKKIENGEISFAWDSNEPLARFNREPLPRTFSIEMESEYCTYNIRRYFTWCLGKKGRIWGTCIDRTEWEDGKIFEAKDWYSLEIEKEDGKWKVVKYINRP